MNRHHRYVAAGPAALAIGGLVLAGCGSASPSSSSSQDSASTTSRSSSAPASGSQGSGGAGAAVGSSLFPVAVGEKWVYADHLGSLGSSTTTNTVAAIKPTSGGNLVTLTNRSSVLGEAAKTTKLTYMFYSNGSIGVPFTQLAEGKITIRSGSIVWPSAADLASGQSHTSVLAVTLNTDGQSLNEKIHVTVKGGGTARVTVPAGTYQATIVDQTMAETIMGHLISFQVRTWLAPGVGPVKDELVGGSSFVPHTVEELKNFTK
jgi:hypothetical protein